MPSGEVLYLSRADFQVKLRGLRIELGEVESAISDYKGIDQAAVMAYGREEEKYLCAFYTKSGEVYETALREHLKKRLPVYMIPSYFVAMDRFPHDARRKAGPQSAARFRKERAKVRGGGPGRIL